MNSMDRFRQRLLGQPVDRPPNFDIMMTFAAHYIEQPLSRYYSDYRTLGDANLAVQAAFHLDLVQVISDPYREASDFGVPINFPYDGLPLRQDTLLKHEKDIFRLNPPDPISGPRMSDRIKAIRYLKNKVGSRIPVMGWVEGAFAEANVLRGDSKLLVDVYDRPEWVEELLDICVKVEISFARAQVEAGADIIGLGDAIASQISRQMYTKFALPYQQKIFSAIHDLGAVTRLHICGNTTHLLDLFPNTGADIVDLDWMVDINQAAKVFGKDGPAICGNFDPVRVMLNGDPEIVKKFTRHCLDQGGQNLFSGAGCEIPDGTPLENLHAQTQALEEYYL
jgi:uroporphyrinogen decarboxylase